VERTARQRLEPLRPCAAFAMIRLRAALTTTHCADARRFSAAALCGRLIAEAVSKGREF
jgi:hypothetical protein